MRLMPSTFAAAFIFGAIIVPFTAKAQAGGPSIYDEARDFERKGRYNDAIERYQKIVDGDRRWSVQAHLADCYLATGQVTRAWSLFRQMAVQAPGDLRDEATQRRKEVEKNSPLVLINLANVAAFPGLEVSVDEVPVPIDGVTIGIPVAPGRYHLHITATGRDPWDDSGLIDRTGLTVLPRFKNPSQAPPKWPTQRTAAIVMGSIGLTGLAFGGVFGGAALVTNKKSFAATCDVGLFAGGGLAVGALILWLTAPKPEGAAKIGLIPMIARDGGGGSFYGSFL